MHSSFSRHDLSLNYYFLAGEKPGLMGKAKHLYQDIKGGSGGNQQESQGRGDDLF